MKKNRIIIVTVLLVIAFIGGTQLPKIMKEGSESSPPKAFEPQTARTQVETPVPSKDESALLSALALNYCRQSLAKILSYNDKMVLDEEYNKIIDQIDRSKITNRSVLESITELMDVLSHYKIADGDKKRIQKRYEKKVSNAIYASFTSGLSNVVAVGNLNPYVLAGTLIANAGGVYTNYRKNLEEYRTELDEEQWKLKKEEIQVLNGLEKQFFKTSWEVTKEYGMPDFWRLDNKQFSYYAEILKDSQADRKYRKLDILKKYFHAFPPFWYYLGISAIENEKPDQALKAFNKFKKIRRGFFRDDTIYTSVLMNEIILLEDKNKRKHKTEILNKLQLIDDEGWSDWRKNLFVATKYVDYGLPKKAEKLLLLNIDHQKFQSICISLLGNLYVEIKDKKNLDKIIDMIVTKDTIKHQETLYLLGQIPEEKWLNIIRNKLFRINIDFNLKRFGTDDIIIHVPLRWISEGFRSMPIAKSSKPDDQTSKTVSQKLTLDNILKNYKLADSEFIPFESSELEDKIELSAEEELEYDPSKLSINVFWKEENYSPSKFKADPREDRISYYLDGVIELDDEILTDEFKEFSIHLDSEMGKLKLKGYLSPDCPEISPKFLKGDYDINFNGIRKRYLFFLDDFIDWLSYIDEHYDQIYPDQEKGTLSKIYEGTKSLFSSPDMNQYQIKWDEMITRAFNRANSYDEKDFFNQINTVIDIFKRGLNDGYSVDLFKEHYQVINDMADDEFKDEYLKPATHLMAEDMEGCSLGFIITEIETNNTYYGITKAGIIKESSKE